MVLAAWKKRDEATPTKITREQKHKINKEKSESSEAGATTSTDKPSGSPTDEGAVQPASYPCDDNDPEVICTRVARDKTKGTLKLTPVVGQSGTISF